MGKHSRKTKVQSPSTQRSSLDENALSQLTSTIEEKLSANQHKRKGPPTEASGKQKQQKQHNSETRSSKNLSAADEAALLAEIKALGGNEVDFDLINQVDSEDEAFAQISTKPVDKHLREELAALSKELGFSEIEAVDDHDSGEQDETTFDDDKNSVMEDGDVEHGQDLQENDMRKVENLLFEPRADWHAARLANLGGPISDEIQPFAACIESLKQHGKYLLETEAAKYRTTIFASSSHKFLTTIMSSGTLTDKISALTLACQESPVHNIRALDTLMNLGSKKSRAQAIGAIGALVDMLGPGSLLPSDRRLRTFQAQPGLLGTLQRDYVKDWNPSQPLPGKITDPHLISWAYEDWLKETYFKIIQLLEVWCSDEIEYSRMRAVDFVYALLKDKPEQESNLLALLVNKLGDRDRKIASRASYLILQMQNSHPRMKAIIIRAVEQEVLLRPTQDHRSKYYAINTLNQTILTTKEPSIAETLLRIYFDLFIIMLKTGKLGVPTQDEFSKEAAKPNRLITVSSKLPTRNETTASSVPETEAADKLVSALLTGVNRAAPFVGMNDTIMEQHIDTLFKIAHSTNFNTSLQALLLIQHLSATKNLASDRFYRVLYESLLDPRLITSSKQALYLNLILRALKNDLDVRRVKAFAKRMLQVAGLHQPPFICGLLYVIAQLRQSFPDLSTLIDVPEESVFDDEMSDERPSYDGRKRHPEHSNAHRSCLWEILPAISHFHPSVSRLGYALLDKRQKTPKPDLESHSLIRFLDKFVYKNAKSTDSARGVSIMQPLRAAKDLGDIWLGGGANKSTTQVNSAAFWNKKVEDVAIDDVFFHQYFQHVSREPKEASKTTPALDGDKEDAEEDEIFQALVKSQPNIDEESSDGWFDDLNDSDMASEVGSSPALSLENYSDNDMDEDLDDEMEEDKELDSDGLVAPEVDDESEEETGTKSEDKRKERRKMLKNLPMFASVDDYAELLAGEEDM